MQNLERRCSDMQQEIFTFKERFDDLLNKGLPSPVIEEGRLMDLEIFVKKINKQVDDQASYSTSTVEGALPTGKSLYEKLESLFYLEHEIKHLFPYQPNFFKYTEADETLRKLQRNRVPEVKWWDEMMELL